MENASNALLMAGGVLIAIVVISLFILGYSNITNLAQSEVDAELIEEINEFNKPLLAFNKKAMYGTDVISILNFAISNNRINNVVDPREELYIDVSFKLRDSVEDTVYEFKTDTSTGRAITTSRKKEGDLSVYGATNFTFEAGEEYSLSKYLSPITAFLQTANQAEETKTIVDTTTYWIKSTGIANFKRKTFKCSSVKYDEYGRINALAFEEIKG